MGLDALQRTALEKAQAAATQAKADADKAKNDAQAALNKPLQAKHAVKAAFAAADAAETAAEDAKKRADLYTDELQASIKDAKAAATRAFKAQINAEVDYESAEKELKRKTGELGPAQDLARDTAKKSMDAALPPTMTDKLNRLLREEAELTTKRDEADRAYKAALAEITQAQNAFDLETKAADETVRCKQGYISKYLYGPTVTDKEKDAKSALEKATENLKIPDQNFQQLEKDLERAVAERQKYQQGIDGRLKLKREAEQAAQKAADALDDLTRDIKTATAHVSTLGTKLTDIKAMRANRDKDLADLQELQDLSQDAADARQAATEARAKALEVCDALNLVAERLDADIDSGAVFKNLTADQIRALKGFNRGGAFGESARRLGPELNNMTEAQFLQKMATETSVAKTKNVASPLGGQQAMKKWEYDDGTVVRYKPDGDDHSGGMATYSVEVKTNKAKADVGLGGIGFKVDPKGRAVPLGPGDVNNPYPGAPNHADYRDQVMQLGHRSLA